MPIEELKLVIIALWNLWIIIAPFTPIKWKYTPLNYYRHGIGYCLGLSCLTPHIFHIPQRDNTSIQLAFVIITAILHNLLLLKHTMIIIVKQTKFVMPSEWFRKYRSGLGRKSNATKLKPDESISQNDHKSYHNINLLTQSYFSSFLLFFSIFLLFLPYFLFYSSRFFSFLFDPSLPALFLLLVCQINIWTKIEKKMNLLLFSYLTSDVALTTI